MRIALAFVLVLASAACAKKSQPATTPAAPAAPAADSAPGGPKPADSPIEQKSDPCDGGEQKAPDK